MPWENTLIGPDKTVRNAIETIQNGGSQICLVVDGDGKLLGTITDGDVRRGLLRGLRLEASVEEVMHKEPRVIAPGADRAEALAIMKRETLRQIPMVDADGRVQGLYRIDDFETAGETRENWVVLMAGGLGSRLQPLTEDKPKPLLSVGDKPILETILESFVEQSFRRF